MTKNRFSMALAWAGLALYAEMLRFLFLLFLPLVLVMSLFRALPHRFRARFWPDVGPLTQKDTRPCIWIHALSLGEMLSALPLVEALREKRPDIRLVCTAATRSGMEAAQKHLKNRVAAIHYFPLDHPLAVHRMLDALAPDLFVLVETDLWPYFMHALSRRKIPALWVNARISDKSLKGYARLSLLMGPAMTRFEAIVPQSPEDGLRLQRLGVGRERLLPWGNLKHDRAMPDPLNPDLEDVRAWILRRRPAFIWICGSLHPGEEPFVAKVLSHPCMEGRNLLTLVVPRHPEKSSEFETRFRSLGLEPWIFSRNPPSEASLAILDRMGILNDLYALGHGALVGGSFVPLRGHNPLEPAMAEVPVLMGPHREDFEESWQGLCAAGGGFGVKDADEMRERLLFWMDHPLEGREAGRAGRRFVLEGRGVVSVIVDWIGKRLERAC
jgi:3-deoxy-D-manno-octulosonic-acid transferase